MTIHLLGFDLDGTLVDSAGEIAAAANRALAEFGFALRSLEEVTSLIGAGAHALMSRLLARAGPDDPGPLSQATLDEVFAAMDRHYASICGTFAQPYDGVPAALGRLREGGVRLACVTNKEMRFARPLLEATGLWPHFDLTLAGDSLAHKKPHGSVLTHLLATFAVPAGAAAHVGDSVTDVAAARNAGVAAWAVPYGYNGGVPIDEAGPDRIFATLADVADCVLSQRLAGC